MFGRNEKKMRVLFLHEGMSGGTLYEPGEVEEFLATDAKRLIADGAASVTTRALNRFDRRHEQPGDWRRNELRNWQERRSAMQQPSE
jgi:hypothetical protein